MNAWSLAIGSFILPTLGYTHRRRISYKEFRRALARLVTRYVGCDNDAARTDLCLAAVTRLAWYFDLKAQAVRIYTAPERSTVLDESQALDR
jgi:hypothetical protein